MEPPEEDEATRRARGYARDSEERKSATAAQVVRQAERLAAGIITTNGLPRNDGLYHEVGSSFRFREKPNQGHRVRYASINQSGSRWIYSESRLEF
jgi:hypothetical protein